MAAKKKKLVLRPYAHPPPAWAKIRTTLELGYTTVQAGPRCIIISKPRNVRDGEEVNDDTEAMLDTITVSFDDEDRVTIKSSCMSFGKGTAPTTDRFGRT